MATSTFSTGIPRIDPTGENTSIIRFVLAVIENASLHPECPLAIASFAVLAFRWLEVSQVLKHHNGCFVLLGKLDNASAHQMSYLLINVADLAP